MGGELSNRAVQIRRAGGTDCIEQRLLVMDGFNARQDRLRHGPCAVRPRRRPISSKLSACRSQAGAHCARARSGGLRCRIGLMTRPIGQMTGQAAMGISLGGRVPRCGRSAGDLPRL